MGATNVARRLPPEVIQRIVRQNFWRFRLCYERGLTRTLTSMVTVSFVIGLDGKVSSAADNNSDLADAETVACVVKSFVNLEFPKPEGDIVTVTYPIRFEQGEKPTILEVGGVGFPSLDAAKVAAKLAEKGWRTAIVSGRNATDPFAVFAIKYGASMSPSTLPRGFLTAVRRVPNSDPSRAPHSNESEGFRIITTGIWPKDLMDDVIDIETPKAP